MPNRLPEHRFAYWLLRESINRITGWLPTILHQQPLLSLASFSRNFGQCLRAGLPVTEAFEKCRLALDSKDLKTRWSGVQQRLRLFQLEKMVEVTIVAVPIGVQH